MYCHGLGDCFLLTFKKGGNNFNMLIDCGVLQGTSIPPGNPERPEVPPGGAKEGDIMRLVAENIEKECGGKLNVVVATHEHHDHICGFKHAQDIFKRITFDEVWLGWTEDPANELAQDLQKKQRERSANLQKAMMRMTALNEKSEEAIDSFLKGFGGDALKAVGDKRAPAWEYLTKGKKDESDVPPKYIYCYPGRKPLTIEGFKNDIRIYVLGPPDKLERLRDLNAPDADRYRHATGLFMDNILSPEDNFFFGVTGDTTGAGCPFKPELRIDEKDASRRRKHKLFSDYHEKSEKWRKINSDWLAVAGEIALKMDSYTNNSSLVLAIELIKSGKVLLFVGDAQFGNWESWHDHEWKITGTDRTEKVIKAEDLLRRTVVYKVGHHGSHNATLKQRGLEMMSNIDQLVALIPVDEELALGKKPHKWEMPFGPLLEDLKKRTNGRVFASDRDLPKGIDPRQCSYDKENLFYGRKLFIDYLVVDDNS
jgi:beta-lactamase superfamily II metal-dependent hydrolase